MHAQQYEREVSVKVINMASDIKRDLTDVAQVQSLAYFLEYLILYLPEPRVEPALEWLLKNGITGKKFLAFVKDECKGSAFQLFTELTKRIEKEKDRRTILSKDMRLS